MEDSQSRHLKLNIDCNIQENLAQHAGYVMERIIPRLSKELPTLLTPQIDQNGQWLQVAESLDFSDLFHVHIRYPLSAIPDAHAGLDERLMDSGSYHLQYHSFEKPEHFRAQWIQEMEKVDDERVQKWLALQKATLEANSTISSMSYGVAKYPKALTEDERDRFVDLWYSQAVSTENRNSDFVDWAKSVLNEKIRYIDQGDRRFPSGVTKNRSVISSQDGLQVIQELNIENYIQPATVYFSERKMGSLIDGTIAKATAQGLNYLVNAADQRVNINRFSNRVRWIENDAFMSEIRSAALDEEEANNIFKNEFADDFNFEKHYIITWDDKYVYSIRYSLQCERNFMVSELIQ